MKKDFEYYMEHVNELDIDIIKQIKLKEGRNKAWLLCEKHRKTVM